MPAKPRSTDPKTDADTEEACHLGALGYSTRMIQNETGFTACQVNYRLHKEGIKRKDYRDGVSEIAQLIRVSTRRIVMAQLRHQFNQNAKDREAAK